MLYIPCVEFQFCIHYVQLPFEKKMATWDFQGGARLWQGGANAPPPPKWNPALLCLCFGALFIGSTRLEYAGWKASLYMYLNEACQVDVQLWQVKLHCGLTKFRLETCQVDIQLWQVKLHCGLTKFRLWNSYFHNYQFLWVTWGYNWICNSQELETIRSIDILVEWYMSSREEKVLQKWGMVHKICWSRCIQNSCTQLSVFTCA